MASASFLDTNILIYAAAGKSSEPRKWAISLDLFEDPQATISAQVLVEFYVNVLRYLNEQTAARWLETLSMMPIVNISAALVLEGAAIAHRFQISYWDAALIAAAKQCGAETLYTEDLNHGQLYESVRVINPFRHQ